MVLTGQNIIVCCVLVIGATAQRSWQQSDIGYNPPATSTTRVYPTAHWWRRTTDSSPFRQPGVLLTSKAKPSCICTLLAFCKVDGFGRPNIDLTWNCDNNRLICCNSLKDSITTPSPPKRSTVGAVEQHPPVDETDLEIANDVDYFEPFAGSLSPKAEVPSISTTTAKTVISVAELDDEEELIPIHETPKCGVASPNLEWKNQYHPDQANFAEFPWTLLLFLQPKGLNKLLVHCGATLVDDRVAVTAAHCVNRKNVSAITVRAGEWDMSNDDEDWPHQDRKIREIVIHPKYDEETLANDIAVLYLDQPFELRNHIKKLCIPYNETFSSTCIATGWGVRGSLVTPQQQTIMKKSILKYVSRQECQRKLRTTSLGEHFRLSHTALCAAGQGEDTCVGDGGGPLFCKTTSEPRKFILVGITSWGKCKDENAPGVYTKIPIYREWLLDKILDSYS